MDRRYRLLKDGTLEFHTFRAGDKYNKDVWIENTEYTDEYIEEYTTVKNNKSEALQYLASTDWIIAKIGEVQLLGQPTADLVTKYQEQLDKRVECRAKL